MDFFRIPGIPRKAPDHYKNHLFFNPPPAQRSPRPPGSPPRVEKEMDFIMVWSDPRYDDFVIHEYTITNTATTTISNFHFSHRAMFQISQMGNAMAGGPSSANIARYGDDKYGWDATNNLGEHVSAGLYLYTIQAGEFKQAKKMVLLK